MQTVYVVEHENGGLWWHFQYGWIKQQRSAMQFNHDFEARAFRDETAHLKDARVVPLKVDHLQHPSVAVTEYDPYGLQKQERQNDNG